jgi:hypothetical protein
MPARRSLGAATHPWSPRCKTPDMRRAAQQGRIIGCVGVISAGAI